MFTVNLVIHIAAGFIALVLFWIPIVTKKGGKIHNRAGWLFVIAMSIVSITAFILSYIRLFVESGRTLEADAFSYFLVFIAILSGATAWHGMRVLRYKNRKNVHRNPIDLGVSFLLFGSGLITSIFGFIHGFPLISYFPIIGIFLGGGQLYYWLTPQATRMHWIYEHLGSMIGCSIATITAFTVFGVPQLLNIDNVNLIIWFLPTILLLPLIIGFTRYYQKKYPTTKVS